MPPYWLSSQRSLSSGSVAPRGSSTSMPIVMAGAQKVTVIGASSIMKLSCSLGKVGRTLTTSESFIIVAFVMCNVHH
ncbi:hypothetical protein CFP66_30510 [Pseudonocardia sp. MH-G8]|nr:hypothetical protein CFP66_30510 [Pseudonocardia sp. MH-G8]